MKKAAKISKGKCNIMMSKDKCSMMMCKPAHGGAYCLGIIGAAVYFIAKAATFWAGVLGFLKALVWPAFVIYGLLKFLGM